MKLSILLTLSLMSFSAVAFENQRYPLCADCFNFAAPLVLGAETIGAPQVGLIVFDTNTGAFRGFTDSATWTDFSIPELWFVDANIGGANPQLGTSAVTAYSEITNSSLSMTQNAGSANVGIACASTNSSTVGNLTCSSSSESVGVTFSIPETGYYRACAEFSHYKAPAGPSGARLSGTFQLIETPSNATTHTQLGNSRITSSSDYTGGAVGNIEMTPLNLCGTFHFSTTGQKTIRLMYELYFTGSVNGNQLMADISSADGQRDIHLMVWKLR